MATYLNLFTPAIIEPLIKKNLTLTSASCITIAISNILFMSKIPKSLKPSSYAHCFKVNIYKFIKCMPYQRTGGE